MVSLPFLSNRNKSGADATPYPNDLIKMQSELTNLVAKAAYTKRMVKSVKSPKIIVIKTADGNDRMNNILKKTLSEMSNIFVSVTTIGSKNISIKYLIPR